ncbi:MAG: MaoC family dehydratase N-terminal domain-containing protein [Smithellaceae bacterium]
MADIEKWKGHARLVALEKMENKGEEEVHEYYTDEAQQRRRNRADKPFYPNDIYFSTQATVDQIRHFAHGIGDQNPLFTSVEYGKKSKYGSVVAPGCYLYSINWVVMGYGGPGVHGWYSGGEWEWYRPIVPGMTFKTVNCLRELVAKKGKMGGGRTWVDYGDVIYVNAETGEVVAKEHQHIVLGERSAAGGAKKYMNIPKPVYSKEDWARILDLYENEEVRGATPRYWEDVNVGDKVGPMIKGPLSVRDEIAWLIGAGTPYIRAHKREYDYEKRHPHTLEYADSSEADNPGDVPELVHILSSFTKTIGIERIYDYGNQRMSWLCNFFTNWMGDDGFLWKMQGDLRVFNQAGDVTTFEGKVVKKYIEDGKYCVDIEAGAQNQRGEWSMPLHISTVILPSKANGPVKYPDPDPKLAEEARNAKTLAEMKASGDTI